MHRIRLVHNIVSPNIIDNIELIEKAEYVGDGTQNYFGVNLSGAEFGGIYPGVDGTPKSHPTQCIFSPHASITANCNRTPI